MKKLIIKNEKFSVYNHITTIDNKKVSRDIIEHNGVAAILAIENDNVILEHQYRFPNGNVIEIPSGTMKKGEKPTDCALREFREETGYEATKLTPLISYYPSISFSTQMVHCFFTNSIKKIGEQKLDEGEIIKIIKINFNDIVDMILSGKIVDSITICAVLTYGFKIKTLKFNEF